MTLRSIGFTILPVVALTVALAGCFPVSVVPASEAPPIPPGSGWSCFEAVPTPKTANARSVHKVHCQRERKDCNALSDYFRRSGSYEATSTCSERPTAYCSASFMSKDDAKWECYGAMEECERPFVAGGVPGMSRSECAAYD